MLPPEGDFCSVWPRCLTRCFQQCRVLSWGRAEGIWSFFSTGHKQSPNAHRCNLRVNRNTCRELVLAPRSWGGSESPTLT